MIAVLGVVAALNVKSRRVANDKACGEIEEYPPNRFARRRLNFWWLYLVTQQTIVVT